MRSTIMAKLKNARTLPVVLVLVMATLGSVAGLHAHGALDHSREDGVSTSQPCLSCVLSQLPALISLGCARVAPVPTPPMTVTDGEAQPSTAEPDVHAPSRAPPVI